MKRLIVAAWLLMPLPCFALSAEDAVRESRALAEQQHYDEALAVLQKAEKQHPGHGEVVLAKARVLHWQGRDAEALAALGRLSAKEQANPDVKLVRAAIATRAKDYPGAEKIYREILVQYPDYADARDGLGRVAQLQAAPVGGEEASLAARYRLRT